MRFRTKRQHLECAICQRHRILIRSFSHHMVARKKQCDAYDRHLRSQYRDRLRYWSVRSESRIHSSTITLIVDGMDQAKFAYPRHPCFTGKQWSNFTRPRAHICGVRVHGYGMFFSCSRADTPKDSSFHAEIISRCLTLVQQKFNLKFSQMHLHIQSDNCVRETKNNSIARWCSLMVSRGGVRKNRVYEENFDKFNEVIRCAWQEPFLHALWPALGQAIVMKTSTRHSVDWHRGFTSTRLPYALKTSCR